MAWCHRPVDLVTVEGPDAAAFLQGQVSQDVEALGQGGTAWALLLEPQGKVDGWVRVHRAGNRFTLVTDAGAGEAVAARLRRFLLRVKVTIAVEAVPPTHVVSVFGPGTTAFLSDDPPAFPELTADPRLVVPVAWPGASGFDVIGDDRVPPPDGAVEVDTETLTALRIESGVPAVGAELVPGRTIPAEAGQWLIDVSVSFTKGCYTGQELVARIDSRGGNVPRHLRGLLLGPSPRSAPDDGLAGPPSAGARPVPGAEIVVDDRVVGTVTSVAWSPGFGALVALGYVGRAVVPPSEAVVAGPTGGWSARIEPLPFAPPSA
jgi:folate-binding protein YgfZ